MKLQGFFISSVVSLVMVLGFFTQVHADLELLGQGTSTHGSYNLIYDTDFDITWYDFTNPVETGKTWYDHDNWASGLSVSFGINVYNDWYLPGSDLCRGNCTGSPMGHLYYTELGNVAGGGLTNMSYFQNLVEGEYWSWVGEAEFDRMYFDFTDGYQNHHAVIEDHQNSMAVRIGRAVAPEPISSVLFVTGGTLLAGRRFMKRNKKA